ncbi:TPA: aminopeptidase P family protein [Candidatus Woesearchaeota archaeon]|nr:hypothetical protein [archaeon]HIJ11793.1 aminopeptidase P family protein [Candidatus Woesearchaeota archaeon]|tara:strand:+ start:1053 stop:2084 length:1032 start_codon:yes stop_codon:yes gene_type:complete
MSLPLLQKTIIQKKIDLAIFLDEDLSIPYLTGFTPSHAVFIVGTKSVMYLTKLDSPPKMRGVVTKILPKEWTKKLVDERVRKVGINKKSMTVSQLESVKKVFPKAKVVDVSKELDDIRSRKTQDEVLRIQKACVITSAAFAALVKELPLKKLKTEMDVAFFLEKFMRSKGCTLAFPTIAAMGKNAATPHHVTGNARLKRGFLLVDFGARFENYCADMTRCVFLGTPNKEEKMLYTLLLEAQELGISLVEEGKSFVEIDAEVKKKLGKYAKWYVHSLGHGIGVEVHEEPFYRKGVKIRKGQCFTIEPGIYIPGKIGLRIEDTLHFDLKVTILTKASKKLQSVKF